MPDVEGGVDMGFIPKDARWYLADIILEHIVEGDRRNRVHINTHLIEAESPEQAHEKSLALGSRSEHEFANTDGNQVRVVFRGLRDLGVIHDALEDGAELIYEEKMGVAEEQLRGWIRSKEQLGVFAPIESNSPGPNCMPESIMKRLEAEGFSREDVEDCDEPGDQPDHGGS
jgi:Domain of unknown function (DUF4288)